MLRRSRVGRTKSPDAAIAPRLRADPLRRVESVVRVIDVWTPVSFRSVATAHVLDDDDVSVRDKGVRNLCRAFLVVGRAQQNYRELAPNQLAVLRGAVDVRCEFDSVPHGNHYVSCFGYAVADVGLSAERNAYGEQNIGGPQ